MCLMTAKPFSANQIASIPYNWPRIAVVGTRPATPRRRVSGDHKRVNGPSRAGNEIRATQDSQCLRLPGPDESGSESFQTSFLGLFKWLFKSLFTPFAGVSVSVKEQTS